MNEKKSFFYPPVVLSNQIFLYISMLLHTSLLYGNDKRNDCVLFYLNNMYKKTYKERGREKERMNFKTAANKNEVNIS